METNFQHTNKQKKLVRSFPVFLFHLFLYCDHTELCNEQQYEITNVWGESVSSREDERRFYTANFIEIIYRFLFLANLQRNL